MRIIFAAFVIGVIVMMITIGDSKELYAEVFPSEVIEFMYSNVVITYTLGGISLAGLANAILLIQYIMKKWSFGIFIILAILILTPEVISVVGLLSLIPCICFSIYELFVLKTENKKKMQEVGLQEEKDIIRKYQEKHQLLEEYRSLALDCKKNVQKISGIYALGLVAVIFVLLFMNSFVLILLALFFFTYTFNILARYRVSSFLPITRLLYEKCDPEACASAIIYYSMTKHNFRLTNQTLFAQCMIYMDDPQLAKASLALFPLKDEASTLSYCSIMAYVYYILKDEEKLEECKKMASKVRLNMGAVGVNIQSQDMAAIQNKIDLMNGDFNTCRKYYLQAFQRAQFPFQKVDASYYIGLISFVEEDYIVAKTYLEKVIQLGNKMHFVSKAEHYLSKINEMNLEE
ncbi:hypothetical protein [Floccifex sp.]|uniref:hypothetical protein n=1 Tax=Floccifex sp. TaxID=2815810 RepID=UPI003F0A609B